MLKVVVQTFFNKMVIKWLRGDCLRFS